MRVSCSYDVHRRCALVFTEDATPRAMANGAHTLAHQATCPNPGLHAVHQEVVLHTRLEQIRGLGGSVHTAQERATDVRVPVAELHISRRSTIPTGTIDLSRSATERGEENIDGGWRGSTPQQPQMETPCGFCGAKIYRPSEVRFRRSAHSHGLRRGKFTRQ